MNIFVGSYTRPSPNVPGAKAKGILRLRIDAEHRQWQIIGNPIPLADPTYLAWLPKRRLLLSVADGRDKPQRLVALKISANYSDPIEVGNAPTHGQASCHIALLPEHKGAAVASYLNACLDTYRIQDDGSLAHTACYPYSGSSIHQRQQEPHAHQACVSPDGRHLYVCDLGADCIWKHPIDAQGLAVAPASEKIVVPTGEGPRHMLFDAAAKRAYSIAELTGRLLVFDWLPQRDSTLQFAGAVDGLPSDYKGIPSGAAIVLHPSGKTLLASQRQHNSIAFFVLPQNGSTVLPKQVCNLPCGGLEPRDCMVDRTGRWLLVANQNSDTVTVFELNPTTGLPLTENYFSIDTPTPVCLVEETFDPTQHKF
ncbi:lactonase family protein [Ruficoccus amylovorans]|uniref:Lactonase family protein n=1 Tax=Ruficoccus amylovorans TaxID=1804625 RepID=A0A842HEG9_9BACT|nr:lactonase family protein [Ruficoccus amylovorans]MBC2594649.1 lactonase family protein [Ruficoccus amylovorans]